MNKKLISKQENMKKTFLAGGFDFFDEKFEKIYNLIHIFDESFINKFNLLLYNSSYCCEKIIKGGVRIR